MSLQSSLFGAPPTQPTDALVTEAPLDRRILALLAAAERTADQISAALGLPVGDVLAELATLRASRSVLTAPDGAWFLPWGSASTSCDSCRPHPETILCCCGHNKEAR